jgi:argininosuccinate synthase
MVESLDKNIYEKYGLKGKPVVVAYSGGLDTTFSTVYLSRICGAKVCDVTVDTGNFSQDKKKGIADRAMKYGASSHKWIDGRQGLFDRYIKYLLFGNYLKGGTYTLSAAVSRYTIAESCAEEAKGIGAAAVAHGCTGAGNDQVRFGNTFEVLTPDLPILLPIRDLAATREQELQFLSDQGFPVKSEFNKGEYSIDEGMWGVTIGGKETKDTYGLPPDSAYLRTAPIAQTPDQPEEVVIGFEKGIPVSLGNERLGPLALIERLDAIAARHGVGRTTALNYTVTGIKGRIAVEAPAASVLIAAHRELEKAVLTRWQAKVKDECADYYGVMIYDGNAFDPAIKDLKALLESSQSRVTGTVGVRLFKGNCILIGSKSPYSLLAPEIATYGEETKYWTGAEAAAFTKLLGVESKVAAAAERKGDGELGAPVP